MTWPASELFDVKDAMQRKNFCALADGSIVLWRLPQSIAVDLLKDVSIGSSSKDEAVGFLLLLRGAQCMSLEGLSTLLGQALNRSRTSSLRDWDKSG